MRRATLVLLLQPMASYAAMVSIDLPSIAMVDGPTVRLGQVARLTSPDLPLLRRLVELPLGSVAGNPDGVLLDRSVLARWVRSQTGLRDDQVEWSGKPATRITVATTRVASEALVDAARTALNAWLAQHAERFDARLVSRLPEMAIQGDAVRLLVQPIRDDRPLPRMQVLVDLVGNGGLIRTVPVSFDVSAHVKGLVARQDINAGSDPSSLLAEQEVEITALRPYAMLAPLTLPASERPLRLRRGLQAGEMVKATDLESAPAVQRGDWITLRLRDGDITMESRAEVLQDGQIGQNVRVKLASGGRSILARVTGNRVVEVSE